jgi:hypothetical protein
MAYSFTSVADGSALSRDTVVANLDGVKVYAHKVQSSALQTSAFVDTNHIMAPRYDAMTNTSTNVTGVYVGQNSGGVNLKASFSTKFNSGRSAIQYRVPVPQTGINIDLVRPCSYFFQWWANSVSKYDGGGASAQGETYLYVYEGSTSLIEILSAQSIIEETAANNASRLVSGGFNTSGFHSNDAYSSSTLNIGVCTDSEAGMAWHYAWGFSLEVFYL